jgi:hypothetical protein
MLEEMTPDTPDKKPRKQREVKPKAKTNTDTDNLAKTLQGLHVMIAMTLALPEMVITAEESKMQADAIQAVMNEYEIPISPATQALVNLAFVSFAVYAPRIQAIKTRVKAEKTEETDKQDEKKEGNRPV